MSKDTKKARTSTTAHHAAWFADLDRIQPGLSARLIHMIDRHADLNVSWALDKIMSVRMKGFGPIISLMGINPDGRVEAPYIIYGHKENYRIFAEYLSAGVPRSRVRESEKTWIVEMPDRSKITVPQLLEAAPSLRIALEKFHAAMQQTT